MQKDGGRAEFDRGKLHASILLALRERPVSVEQIGDNSISLTISN